jgi:PAS domain S-box-containing protein
MQPRSSQAATPAALSSTDVFAEAFRNSPAMQTVTRASDRILIEANETFIRKLGYTREEVIGRTTLDLNLWVSPQKIQYFREQLDAQGMVRDFEVELCTKSGEILIVLLQADMVEIGGEPHVVAAGVDITARHRAQAELQRTHERLRQSEELFSKAFRANPALVTITRLADGTLAGVNEAFLRATGYTEAEVLGRTANDLGLHAAPGQRERFVGEITARGSIREVEFVIRTKGGDVRTLLVSGERTDIEGTPHVLTVGLDITERKRADAKLRENELKLRENEARISTAFHASPALMTIARLSDGGYVEVNDAFVRWLGVEREKILGRSWQEFAFWEDPAAGERFFAELMRTRSVRNVECPLRRRDGETRVLQVSADIIEINREPHILGLPSISPNASRRRPSSSRRWKRSASSASLRPISSRWCRTSFARRSRSSCLRSTTSIATTTGCRRSSVTNCCARLTSPCAGWRG